MQRGLQIILVQACHLRNEELLRALAKGKCARLDKETYGRKEYLHKKNIFHVRQQFRHDRRFAGSQWLCKCQEAREEESHLLSGQCKVYGDLALQYSDFTNDDNLAQFFSEVLARRDQLDKE